MRIEPGTSTAHYYCDPVVPLLLATFYTRPAVTYWDGYYIYTLLYLRDDALILNKSMRWHFTPPVWLH
jgi:hypothetical protein